MYYTQQYGASPRSFQKDHPFGRHFRSQSNFVAAVNIEDALNSYELSLTAPGRKKENFKIALNEDVLTVAYAQPEQVKNENADNAGNDQPQPVQEKKWLHHEYTLPNFSRSFRLNEKVDASKISARYEDGILLVTLPKKEEAQQPKLEIAVN